MCPLFVLAIFQVINRHMWLVATILNSSDIEHFHHHRTFYWTHFLGLSDEPQAGLLKNTLALHKKAKFWISFLNSRSHELQGLEISLEETWKLRWEFSCACSLYGKGFSWALCLDSYSGSSQFQCILTTIWLGCCVALMLPIHKRVFLEVASQDNGLEMICCYILKLRDFEKL